MHMPADLPQHPRRGFLGRVAAGAVTLLAGRAALLQAEDVPASALLQDADAWLAKLHAAHRQYFDAVSLNDGFPLAYALNWGKTMRETYKLPAGDVQSVVGFRHMSIGAVLNDAMWDKYKLGEFYKLDDPKTKAPARRNIYNNSQPGDTMFPDANVSSLLALGNVVVGCNLALSVLSGMAAGAAGLKMAGDAAHKEWVANLIPGVIPVASGVLAVHRAQEKGKCTYCYAG
jgi:hypothetical protein